MVNAVMVPIKSYFNLLEYLLEDTKVDNASEHLFSLESIGINTTEQDPLSLESEQIKNFEEGISFKGGHHQVELSWHQDKIQSVPSNHSVALKVLDRTLETLKRKQLLDQCQAVFEQQKIWIPH